MVGDREIEINSEIDKIIDRGLNKKNNTGPRDFEDDTEKFCQALKNSMTEERWQHSLGVAETARKLALFWGADPFKAWLAGIFHDYARELTDQQLIKIAEEHGLKILPEERENPVVLHAPLGALLVRRDFDITDKEILRAISYHTVGGESLTLLDKIVFLADLVEPGRCWPGVDQLRAMIYQDLDKTLEKALDGTIKYLKGRGKPVHPTTLAVWHQMQLLKKSRE